MAKHPLQRLFFPVRKEANVDFSPGFSFESGISHRIVATTPDGDRVIHYCSEDYELLTNEEIMIPFYERITKDHDVDISILSDSYSQFHVNYITKDEKIKKANKEVKVDDVFPAFRQNNSYNGRSRYGYEAGLYRVVCKNGLKVPVADSFKSKTMMHTGGIAGDSKALDSTIKWVDDVLLKMPKVDELFQPLKEAKYSFDEGLERLDEIKNTTQYPSKKIEHAAARLAIERDMGYHVSDYLVYNALNHALYQTPDAMEVHKKDKVDREVLEFLIDTALPY